MMVEKKVEIFNGDIGTVRNELTGFMKNVNEIVSLTQSVTTSLHHSSPMLTVILVYREYVECPEEFKYKSNERYL